MKRVLLLILALSMLLCLAGCNNGDTNATTTAPVSTTVNNEEANKQALAQIGFSSFVGYLNLCAAYGVPVDIAENDTIDAIASVLRSEGSVLTINNINVNARFFDYAVVNPDYASGGDLYVLRADADWLALYVD
ncbi:MAG: hypothetical protein IKY44_05180 [Clostridia bacterium]|nr:hypothetical protein [Clostridia bacterium]